MKKFNLVLLVLVAALFGSSLVACSNGTGGFEFQETQAETPAEPYIEEVFDNGITVVKFIPFPGCSNVDEVETQIGYAVGECSDEFDFESYFGTRANVVKNRILHNSLYHNNDYIVLRFDNDVTYDVIYKLVITDTDEIHLIGTDTSYVTAR